MVGKSKQRHPKTYYFFIGSAKLVPPCIQLFFCCLEHKVFRELFAIWVYELMFYQDKPSNRLPYMVTFINFVENEDHKGKNTLRLLQGR